MIKELNFKPYDFLYESFYNEKSVVYDDLVKYKGTDLSGRKINNEKDLAVLATVFRDDRWETFRIIYMKDNKVVSENGITSRLHNSSDITLNDEKAEQMFTRHKVNMERLDSNGYYLMHNHPSKNSHTPSKTDIDTTKRFIDNLPGFRGHIITSQSGASFIDKDLNVSEVSNSGKLSLESVDGDEILKIGFEEEKDKRFTLIYLNNDNEVVLIQTADEYELKNIDQFENTLFNFKRKIGAQALYLIVYTEEQLQYAFVYGASILNTITQVIYINTNEKSFKAYGQSNFPSIDTPKIKIPKKGRIKSFSNN